MRTDERDAQAGQESKGFSVVTYVVIVLAVLLLLFIFFLPSSGCTPREPANITKCKNGLKAMGMHIQNYYSDGAVSFLPSWKNLEISGTNDGGFGFEDYILRCPTIDNGPYVWNSQANGALWSDWNHPHSPLIWDASPHKITNKINVLFGDGHVEEITPERLRELTR